MGGLRSGCRVQCLHLVAGCGPQGCRAAPPALGSDLSNGIAARAHSSCAPKAQETSSASRSSRPGEAWRRAMAAHGCAMGGGPTAPQKQPAAIVFLARQRRERARRRYVDSWQMGDKASTHRTHRSHSACFEPTTCTPDVGKPAGDGGSKPVGRCLVWPCRRPWWRMGVTDRSTLPWAPTECRS